MAAMFVPLQGYGVSVQSSLNLGKTLLRITHNEKQQRPNSWQSFLYIYHLSYPVFVTLFIEWLRFLGWIT